MLNVTNKPSNQVAANNVRERAEGLANLKHVLRCNQQSSQVDTLVDGSFHKIYETLFRVAIAEQSGWLNAKTSTTKSAADTRLSNTSSALRLAVEVGAPLLKLKTVRAVLDHVIQTLPLSSGGLCTPLALDYAKCLRTALSYQPHVEHLPQKDWERTAIFCVDMVKSTEADMADDDAVSGAEINSTAGTVNGLSIRSSRSHFKESAGSQGMRSLVKQVMEELVGSLSLLTAAPNAHIRGKSSVLLWALIDYLKSTSIAGRSHQEAFAAINHILAWTSTEDITLTQKATSHLIRLIRHFWPQKASVLKDEMLTTLLHLQLYMAHLMRQDEALTLRTELSGLLDVLRAEYGKRLDREQLHLDDLRLAVHPTRTKGDGSVHTAIFSLRCAGARAEANYVLVEMFATLCSLLSSGAREHASSDDDADDALNSRPRKRQRLTNDYEDALASTSRGPASSRVCALQSIAFLGQQKAFTPKQIGRMVDKLSVSCAEDNAAIASWALLALSSCTSQAYSNDSTLAARWNGVWQLAIRGMSNTSTCRSACLLLSIMVRLQLVGQTTVSELVQTLTGSMDLNGPSMLADSVLHLLWLTLGRAQQLSPGTLPTLAESLLGWLFRMFTPSKFEDKMYAAAHHLYQPADALLLMNACLGHRGHSLGIMPFPLWDAVAQTWLACEDQQGLVRYLLLLPKVECPTSQDLLSSDKASSATSSIARATCETLALNHLTAELHRTQEVWSHLSRERPRSIGLDMFRSLCDACCTISCTLHCRTFRDARRQMQAQKQLAELLKSLSDFVAGLHCDQDKVDSMLSAISPALTGAADSRSSAPFTASSCEKLLCRHVTTSLSSRRQTKGFNGQDEDEDMMDMDDMFDSQDSRRGKATVQGHVFTTDSAVAFSPLMMRSNVDLYAAVITAIDDAETAVGSRVNTVSSGVVDHILSLPEPNVLACRRVLSALPGLGLLLHAPDAERLLEYCTERMLSSYRYERSEVAIGAILDTMSSLTPVWTDKSNQSLHGLGLDMYEWYMHVLSVNVLSPNVQKRVATLLLQLCQVDTDYGRENDVQSVRTSLFQLLKAGSIRAQHHLAGRISAIFRLFVLSAHEAMFDDLQSSLPAEADWVEGLAMRLLFLAKLASAWHSLLRHCVYYIFETAGRVKGSAQYAAHCVKELSESLEFDSAQKLFRLFAPQLLHTWLEDHTLTGLPYAAFQYASLDELLERNQVEITAQLLMRGKEDSMHVITQALKVSGIELTKQSFAKTVAYAVSWDVSKKSSDPSNAASEARLRGLVGGKDELRKLIQSHFPAVLGQFFLSAQQEDAQDKWLERRENYASAAKALSDAKSYSFSTRTLPPSQQPSFKAKFLPDQIERLCRRTGHDPSRPWTPSTFALAVRMLLDAVDDALGPLHKCLMLRKLRLLVCMAGEVALSGFPLEMLVNSILPFVSDSECADDALGVLQYLLDRGQPYLKREAARFAHGTILVLILRMQEHSVARQESTTQESQHKLTVQKMEVFQTWLVKYLQQCRQSSIAEHSATHAALVTALGAVRLPGNACKSSPESSLLLLLLEQGRMPKPLVSQTHCAEGLRLLAKDFKPPASVAEDCLGSDHVCASYADSLWRLMRTSVVDDGMLVWAAAVLGRAYASTGVRPLLTKPADSSNSKPDKQAFRGVAHSQLQIAHCLSSAIQLPERAEAGLADWTLRNALLTFEDAGEALTFEQMLPASLVPAVADGSFGYKPPLAAETVVESAKLKQVQQALEVSPLCSDEVWTKRLAVTLCVWASRIPLLPALPALLQNIPGLAMELLPSIIHMVLVQEADAEPVLRAQLSQSISAHLASRDPLLLSRQRFLLSLVLYLRSQPLPGEITQADRVRWLDVDLLLAADAAARCEMPTSALMLAESVSPVAQPNRRSSSRVSMSQLTPVQVPDDLLLSIFKQIEEPDSYYGVQQSASLDSVLERLDYEGDGLRSLMFRSAHLDSAMRIAHRTSSSDSVGLMHSLSALNLHSLEYALLSGQMGNEATNTKEMLDAARRLQQWDLASPEIDDEGTATVFSAFQELSRTGDRALMAGRLHSMLLGHINSELGKSSAAPPPIAWCNALATLTEMNEALDSLNETGVQSCWQNMQTRQQWMRMARFEDCNMIISSRSTLFGVLAQNSDILKELRVGVRASKTLEVQSLLQLARLAREHGILQEALSATTQASLLAAQAKSSGLNVTAAAEIETALILWETGEASTSVKMLRNVLAAGDSESQDLPIGHSGLLAQLAHQLADARLEKPDEILASCLKPAIENLRGRSEGSEAGKVFHEFAAFCEQQLQNPGNLEDFNRIARLRVKKREQIADLKALASNPKKTHTEREEARKAGSRTQQWFDIDETEFKRLKESRDTFLQQSLQNYLLALHASDQHDICVLRFFALWLESADAPAANAVVSKHLPVVPSWKFAVLNNQLMSRLENEETDFQRSLKTLVHRICTDHPHHTLHQLYAATRAPTRNDDTAAQSRFRAARGIRSALQNDKHKGDFVKRVFETNGQYNLFAQTEIPKGSRKIAVESFPPAVKMTQYVVQKHVPPATISVPLHPDGKYPDIPTVVNWGPDINVMNGNSHPMALTAIASNGTRYKQLLKGSDDDLRQDAIMEQVFEEVSKMLRKQKAARQRGLHVRTYRVVPLTSRSGILEWVPNSLPIGEFLKPAHQQYYPQSIRSDKASNAIRTVERHSVETRIKEFRKVCDHLPPVMRHFFFELFINPDDWFEKRTAYTRTTATVSILGYVLGLGDRHCHNILLDQKSGEAVHIDLGVAFEAGRVLPVPEMVPFRLSRDIIDGMGITKTEGVFRRCCEFTMDALREDKDSIMTLLNVLRYDPLYSWTVSPLRAKRMQDAQDTGRNDIADDEEASSKRKEQEAGEADRALGVVEKKLSKTMSTAATVNELIQQATDERNLATLFAGWSAFF